MKLRRVFVTGASGFIGTHVCRALVDANVQVVALIHRSEPKIEGIEVVQGGVEDLDAVGRALTKCDAVLHLAAFIPPNFDDPSYAEECFRSNALFTLRLVERALIAGQMRLVYLSSAQAYAYAPTPVDETQPLYPASRAPYYLGSKLLGEIYVEHLHATRGLEAITLRLGSVYGPGMPENSVVARFMHAACAGRTLQVANGGSSSVDFVSVSDVIWAVLEAAQRGKAGVFNIASGVASSILDLARTVAEVFHDRQPDMKILPMRSAPPASFSPIDIAKAKREWGYRPIALREGLTRYRVAMEGQQ